MYHFYMKKLPNMYQSVYEDRFAAAMRGWEAIMKEWDATSEEKKED